MDIKSLFITLAQGSHSAASLEALWGRSTTLLTPHHVTFTSTASKVSVSAHNDSQRQTHI